MPATAKLFKNGSSQAVRLPREFRFDGDEVCIKRIGSAILLFPKNSAWDLMGHAIQNFDADFMAQRNQPQKPDARPSLTPKKNRKS